MERPSFSHFDDDDELTDADAELQLGLQLIHNTPLSKVKGRIARLGFIEVFVGFFLLLLAVVAHSSYGFTKNVRDEDAGMPAMDLIWICATATLVSGLVATSIWYIWPGYIVALHTKGHRSLKPKVACFMLFAAVAFFTACWLILSLLLTLYKNKSLNSSTEKSARVLLATAFLFDLVLVINTPLVVNSVVKWYPAAEAQERRLCGAGIGDGHADRMDDLELGNFGDGHSEEDSSGLLGHRTSSTTTTTTITPQHVEYSSQGSGFELNSNYKQKLSPGTEPAPLPSSMRDMQLGGGPQMQSSTFEGYWASLPVCGSVDCSLAAVPSEDEISTHLREKGFQIMALGTQPSETADGSMETKAFFYAHVQLTQSQAWFFGEFTFNTTRPHLHATFKSEVLSYADFFMTCLRLNELCTATANTTSSE
jgi:hypothetical protein